MDNIISNILEIDKLAQERLAEGEALKKQIVSDADEEIVKKKAETQERINEKLVSVKESEELNAEEEKRAARSQSDGTMKQLEQVYNDIHEKTEEDIFKKVISL